MYPRLWVFSLALLVVGCPRSSDTTTSGEAEAPEEEPADEEAPVEEAPVEEAPPAAIVVAAADIPWAPPGPQAPEGVEAFAFRGDMASGFTGVIRLQPGTVISLHAHPHTYSAVALSEGMNHGTTEETFHAMPMGTAWTQPAGEAHVDGCISDAPCVFAIDFDGPLGTMTDVEPLEGASAGGMWEPSDYAWQPINPDAPDGPKILLLTGDHTAGAFTALAHFPAGLTMPLHTHDASYAGVVVSGTIHHGSNEVHELGPGSVWTTPAGEVHLDSCASDEGCVFFVSMDGALSMTPVEPLQAEEASIEEAEPAEDAAPAPE